MSEQDAREFTLTGMTIHIRLHSDDSNGALSIIEEALPPGTGSPLHTIRESSTLYILAGTVMVTRGDSKIEAKAGDLVYIPHGVPRNITNTSTGDARVLVIIVPGGYEQFLQALHQAGRQVWSDPHRLEMISARYGVAVCQPE